VHFAHAQNAYWDLVCEYVDDNKTTNSSSDCARFRKILDKLILWIFAKSFGLALAIFLDLLAHECMSHNNGIAGRGRVVIVNNPGFPAHDFFESGKKFPDQSFESPFDLEIDTGDTSLFWSAASFMQFTKLRKQKYGIEYRDYYRKYPDGLKGAQVALRRNCPSLLVSYPQNRSTITTH